MKQDEAVIRMRLADEQSKRYNKSPINIVYDYKLSICLLCRPHMFYLILDGVVLKIILQMAICSI